MTSASNSVALPARRPANGHGVRARRLVASLGAVAFLLCSCSGPLATAAAHSSAARPTAWMRHIDHNAGFTIDYPARWNVYRSQDPGVQFLAGPDGQDFVLVRVIAPLPLSVGSTDLQAMRQIIDGMLAKQPINIRSEQQVTLAGLPGWDYVYSFADPKLGTGLHVHLFLFKGNRLYTLVLQALPASRWSKLQPEFEQILQRFRVL